MYTISVCISKRRRGFHSLSHVHINNMREKNKTGFNTFYATYPQYPNNMIKIPSNIQQAHMAQAQRETL